MARNNHVFLVGDLSGNIRYDVLQLGGKEVQYLRINLFIKPLEDTSKVRGLPVVMYGPLAELVYGHIQTGSRIAVMGHIQQRVTTKGFKSVEIVAEEVQFIRNIDWERGEDTRKNLVNQGHLRPSHNDLVELGENYVYSKQAN